MELTPANSPRYGIADVKKQNLLWKKRVRDEAKKLPLPELILLVQKTRELIDRTEAIAVAMTEKARLSVLEKVLAKRDPV